VDAQDPLCGGNSTAGMTSSTAPELGDMGASLGRPLRLCILAALWRGGGAFPALPVIIQLFRSHGYGFVAV